MPLRIGLLDRLPLPSLQTYTIFSFALLSCALLYSHRIVKNSQHTDTGTGIQETTGIINDYEQSDELTKTESLLSKKEDLYTVLRFPKQDSKNSDEFAKHENTDTPVSQSQDYHSWNGTLPYNSYMLNILFVISAEVWGIWILVNIAYCCLILLGKLIQVFIFGQLRVIEGQNLRDSFWNFVFYKCIFIFGVMNAQTMEEVVTWVAWFTTLGFFSFLTQLSKDRFEYVTSSPATPNWVHLKILCLLVLVLSCMSGLIVVSLMVGLHSGYSILAFLAAECLLIILKAFYVVCRYAIHLFDMNMEGIWENRSTYVYYTELIFELTTLCVDFTHHLHMLLWGNIFLSMASLVIFMHLRYLMYDLQRRYRRHKNYLGVLHKVQSRFAMASREEIDDNCDNCAICWEKMESARKLPCSHLFHNSCLRSWLEQDTSCPTCRVSLSEPVRPTEPASDNNNRPPRGAHRPPNVTHFFPTMNHFFHFDASRYVSWLPSFSVEVTHTRPLLGNAQAAQIQSSRLENMAHQVHSIFPQTSMTMIMDDLQVTQSFDHTIENILEGRLGSQPAPGFNDFGESAESNDEQQLVLPTTVSSTGARVLQAAWNQGRNTTSQDRNQSQNSSIRLPESDQPVVSDNLTPPEVNDKLPSAGGSRFSKSPYERETILRERKAAMLEAARRRYLSSGASNSE